MSDRHAFIIILFVFIVFCVETNAVVASSDDSNVRIDMLNKEGKLKLKNDCILATFDEVFCVCLSEQIGSFIVDRFGFYVDGMSNNAEKRNHVRDVLADALKGTDTSVEEIFKKWNHARDTCRQLSIKPNQPIKPTQINSAADGNR